MASKFKVKIEPAGDDSGSKPNVRVVRVNDVWDSITEKRKLWQEEKRVGTVGYDEEFGAVTFHYDETGDDYRYYIYLDKIKTPEEQMRWLNHLRRKGWFTCAVMNDFFDCLEYLGLVDDKV